MHCDSLTKRFDSGSLDGANLQAGYEKLNKAGCAAQCFAVFTEGAGAAFRFEKYLAYYKERLKEYGLETVTDYAALEKSLNSGKTGAILTVENLGFLEELSSLTRLKEAGVRMASLVWNYENSYAYPNLIFEKGSPCFLKREKRGLKEKGKLAVEMLDELKIIIDISHLSDGGAEEILRGRSTPAVASHSNAAGVEECCRNLTDGQIKALAECGGVVGVNFCKDFLGGGEIFEAVLKHIKHIINTGGEDVVAFGSDFDGIPATAGLEDCLKMPSLLEYLSAHGISARQLEKLCFKNFARVFKDVCG